jgi:hypothetical protein
MLDFWTWLLEEGRREWVPQGVLQGYEAEFQGALEQLIRRTTDPVLRGKFEGMRECPIWSGRTGRCYPFSDFIVSTLLRNGIHHVYDVESALAYVVEKMLLTKTDTGAAKGTVFGDFDETRPYTANFNPLQARFLKFLQFAMNNIKKGRIPRLARQEPRPPGTVSIGLGRPTSDDPGNVVYPDEIPARPTNRRTRPVQRRRRQRATSGGSGGVGPCRSTSASPPSQLTWRALSPPTPPAAS